MKKISDAKVECLKKLLERVLKFRCKGFCASCDFNTQISSIYMSIQDKNTFDNIIVFNFYYDNMEAKDIEKLIFKIINVLDEIKEKGRLKSVIKKLPIDRYGYVDIDKFVGGKIYTEEDK